LANIHNDDFHCITFSPGGDLIISGANDDTVQVWKWETGENIATFPEARIIRAIAINAKGLIIAIDSSRLMLLQLNNSEKAN
jgi:WD40 repeat protein